MGLLPYVPLLLAGSYALWQAYNYYFWRRATRQTFPETDTLPSIAVVVPFRDEVDTLPYLLASLALQDYPADRYEVILVDDHSSDGGGDAGRWSWGETQHVAPIRVLRLADHVDGETTVAHKKAALALGIAHSSADLIVTTDADCTWPRGGLRQLARGYATGADVLLGPVTVEPATDLCAAFQGLDFLGYQLFTAATVAAGTPALANGAHFAFRRTAFERVGGYAGVDHLPSGDDVLLLHKFMAAGMRVACSTAPAAVVTTRPEIDWPALWRQRLRWAGKAGEYGSPVLQLAQGLAYLTSLGIVAGLLIGLLRDDFFTWAVLAWGMKALVDYTLLRDVARHYGQEGLLKWYGAVQLVYPFYLVAVGTAALLGMKAAWKGRL